MKESSTPNKYLVRSVKKTSSKHRSKIMSSNSSTRIETNPFHFLDLKKRSFLADGIAAAIKSVITDGKSVFLPGFGIFTPIESSKISPRIENNNLILVKDEELKINFEKCDDDSHLGSRANRIEWLEFASRVRNYSAALGLVIPTIDETKAVILGFVEQLKKEVVCNAYSLLLPQLGHFCALHNRQGQTQKSWFAGADIFLALSSPVKTSVEVLRKLNNPEVNSAWEPLEAAYDKSIYKFEIDLIKVLSSLGFDAEHLNDNSYGSTTISVSVFLNSKSETLIFCTDGLRKLAKQDKSAEILGSELLVQAPISESEDFSQLFSQDSWVSFQIVIGWSLLQTAKSKTIKPGAAFSLDIPLIESSKLSAIFCHNFTSSHCTFKTSEGEFRYICLTGITADEFEAAKVLSPKLLEAFLDRRGLLGKTQIGRSSVFRSTQIHSSIH